ncbi:MAG TPA: AraC family transcriptional regulator [Acidimicrobiales bacterium]|nr:AraC family transcriptional regulator [Acidimicrobiales bacterium]
MDALVGLLDGVRARGAFLLRAVLDPPWSLRIEDEAPLTLMAVARGEAWLGPVGGEPERVGPGDIAIARGPDHYVVSDRPGTPPTVIIHPGERCTTLSGEDLALTMHLGVRTWGNHLDGETVLLTGTYQGHSEVSRRLLGALPPLAVVRADADDAPLLDLLAREIDRDVPGQEVVLDRLLDLLLIAVVRTWLARAGDRAPAWWRADADPVVGPALRLLHADPARPWTVAGLAAAVGVSRAGLARRFVDLVGEPPMAFLTAWRLALAADRLLEPGVTIGAVAGEVGYGSPFALSAAFKRAYGVSPHEHRQAALAAAAATG